MSDTPTVGFIGLGYMGHAMAANLLKKGFELVVVAHRKREAVEQLVAEGAREVPSPADVARACDVLIVCVPGAAQVEEVTRGERGIAAGARPGLIVVDCTTSGSDRLIGLQQNFQHLVFVDAPLGRSPQEAWAAELSVMVGCEPDVFARIRPVLAAFASTIHHVGPLGSGHKLKLVNNFVSLGYAAIYSEAMLLAVKSGLTTRQFDELVRSSRMDCEFFRTFMGWTLDGNSESHQFSLANASRTASDIVEMTHGAELRGDLIASIASIYKRAVAQGMGECNLPELPRSVAEDARVELRPLSPSKPARP